MDEFFKKRFIFQSQCNFISNAYLSSEIRVNCDIDKDVSKTENTIFAAMNSTLVNSSSNIESVLLADENVNIPKS